MSKVLKMHAFLDNCVKCPLNICEYVIRFNNDETENNSYEVFPAREIR